MSATHDAEILRQLHHAADQHRRALDSMAGNLPARSIIERDLAAIEESISQVASAALRRERDEANDQRKHNLLADPGALAVRLAHSLDSELLFREAAETLDGRDSALSVALDDQLRAAMISGYDAERAASPMLRACADRPIDRWGDADQGVAALSGATVPVVSEAASAAALAFIDPTANSGSVFPIRGAFVELTTQRRSAELGREPLSRRFELLGRAWGRTEARAAMDALVATSWASATAIAAGGPTAANLQTAIANREAITIGGERPPRAKILICSQRDSIIAANACASGDLTLAGLVVLPVDGLTAGTWYLLADMADCRAIELRRPVWDQKPSLERRSPGFVSRMLWSSTLSISPTINTSGAGKPLGAYRITAS